VTDHAGQAPPRRPRLFVAVPVPAPAVAEVRSLVDGLPPPDGRPVRWVRLDGLHLTIRFLGPTPEDRIAEVERAIAATAAAWRPFAIRVHGGGAFPSLRRPRAIWLGIAQGADDLTRLRDTLGEHLARTGWPVEDRPYRAHLTLARSDGLASGAAVAAALADAAEALDVSFVADRLVLFESRTGGGPARYEELRGHSLGG
jgi:2'-5' RNA ligase